MRYSLRKIGATTSSLMHIPLGGEDLCCWDKETAGTCSIKVSTLRILETGSSTHGPYGNFLFPQNWSFSHGKPSIVACWPGISCLENPSISHLCVLCRQEIETVDHLLSKCLTTKRIWHSFPSQIPNPTMFSWYIRKMRTGLFFYKLLYFHLQSNIKL